MSPTGELERVVKNALKAKNWRYAREMSRTLLEQNGAQRREILEPLVEAEFNLGNFEECLSLCRSFFARPEAQSTALATIQARVLSSLGRTHEARNAYLDLTARHPEFRKGYVEATNFFLDAGFLADAAACIDRLFERIPDSRSASAELKRARIYESLGDVDAALASLSALLPKSRQGRPTEQDAAALLAVGRLELRAGRFLSAQRHFHHASESTNARQGLRALAAFWLSHSSPEMARFYFRELWKRYGEARDFVQVIECYVRQCDLEKASRLFNRRLLRVLGGKPIDGEWLNRLCQVFREEFGTRYLLRNLSKRRELKLFSRAVELVVLLNERRFGDAAAITRELATVYPDLVNVDAFLKDEADAVHRDNAALVDALERLRGARPDYVPQELELHFVSSLAMGGLERRLSRTVLARAAKSRQLVCILRTQRPDRDAFRTLVGSHENVEIIELSDYLVRDDAGIRDAVAQDPVLAEVELLPALASLLSEVKPQSAFLWGIPTFEPAGSAAFIARVPNVVCHDGSVAPVQRTQMTPAQIGRFHYLADLLRLFLREPGWALVSNGPRNLPGAIEFVGGDIPLERFYSCEIVFPKDIVEQRPRLGPAALREKLRIPMEAPVIGFVGRLSREKNLALWLEIARQLSLLRSDAHFIIVGDGPGRTHLQTLAKRKGLEERCHFVGRQGELLRSYYEAMTLFLLTSDYEGLPNVVLEAQALGIPVAARDTGGTADAFDAGKSGLLISGGEPTAFVAAIQGLLNDPERLRAMSMRGPEYIREATVASGVGLVESASFGISRENLRRHAGNAQSGVSRAQLEHLCQNNPLGLAHLITDLIGRHETYGDTHSLETAREAALILIRGANRLGATDAALVFNEPNNASASAPAFNSIYSVAMARSLMRLDVYVPGFAVDARRFLSALTVPVEDGGASIEGPYGTFIGTQSAAPNSYALTKWLTTVRSLLDAREELSRLPELEPLLGASLRAVHALIPLFDAPAFSNSRARLAGPTRLRLLFSRPVERTLHGFEIHIPLEGSFISQSPPPEKNRWAYYLEREETRFLQLNIVLSRISAPRPNRVNVDVEVAAPVELTLQISEGDFDPLVNVMPASRWRQLGTPQSLAIGRHALAFDVPVDDDALFAYPCDFRKGAATSEAVSCAHITNTLELAQIASLTGDREIGAWAEKWLGYTARWADDHLLSADRFPNLQTQVGVLNQRVRRLLTPF